MEILFSKTALLFACFLIISSILFFVNYESELINQIKISNTFSKIVLITETFSYLSDEKEIILYLDFGGEIFSKNNTVCLKTQNLSFNKKVISDILTTNTSFDKKLVLRKTEHRVGFHAD
jgi:uncharacterized protein (DUF2225 family)